MSDEIIRYADLVGPFMLQGVDYTPETIYDYGGACIMLDGQMYEFIIDPDDGWRSYVKNPVKVDGITRNSFPGQEVIGYLKDSYYIVFKDAVTGGVVLEIGTDHEDEWYPLAIFSYHPENLAINN